MDYKSDLKKIQSLKNKKYRLEYGKFFIEGEKIIKEALDSDFVIEDLWINEQYHHKISQKATKKGIEVKFVSAGWLERAGSLKSNNFGIAVLKMKDGSKPVNPEGWIIALDQINDPGNLGTILRIADWYGINTVICSENSVDYTNPKVLMASKGSFLRLEIVYCDLSSFLESYKGIVLAADLSGQNIHDLEMDQKSGLLLMGSESHGISSDIDKFIHKRIHIPGKGQAESLNVAISTAIILDNLNRSGLC